MGSERSGVPRAAVADALDALAHRCYEVILADYDMPDIAGLSLLAALQGAAPTTPRILCAELTRELLAQARAFEIVAVLAKPVPPERLIVVVGAVVASGRGGLPVPTSPMP